MSLINFNRIKNSDLLTQLDQSRFQNGEIIYVEEEEKICMYNEGKWIEISASLMEEAAEQSGLQMSLYDINKQVISQLNPITDFMDIIERINTWRQETNNEYYLLYGKEISYFTLFAKDILSHEDLGTVTIDCLRSVGCVYAIDLNEDNVWEIWCDWDGEATCLYLFPYDNGVVTII